MHRHTVLEGPLLRSVNQSGICMSLHKHIVPFCSECFNSLMLKGMLWMSLAPESHTAAPPLAGLQIKVMIILCEPPEIKFIHFWSGCSCLAYHFSGTGKVPTRSAENDGGSSI